MLSSSSPPVSLPRALLSVMLSAALLLICSSSNRGVITLADAIAATSVTLDDLVENYRDWLTAAVSSYTMRAKIQCTSGACMSNPSAYIAGIEVGGIGLTVSDTGKAIVGYPTVPIAELFTVLPYASAPTQMSTSDGLYYKFPLKLDYTRFVNGSAPSMLANSNMVPSYVASVTLEALMYYGIQQQGMGGWRGTDPATYWFDAAEKGPTAAGDPVATLATGTYTVVPPNGGASYSMALANFTNISYAVQFSSFESVTVPTTGAAASTMLVPSELRVRETFNQYYHDVSTLDAGGRPTVRRLAGPPGAVVSNWYVTLSSVTPVSYSSDAVAQQQQADATKAAWEARRSSGGLQNYSYVLAVECVGAGCGTSPPEFPHPALGITSQWDPSNPTAAERIIKVVYPYADGSASEGLDLTYDADARAAAKTMTELITYSNGIPRLNAMANGYPSASMTLSPQEGLVAELTYRFSAAYRNADSYPSFFGYTHVSRSATSLPNGYADLIPFGPPRNVAGDAVYTLRASNFVPNAAFVLVSPTTTAAPSRDGSGSDSSSGFPLWLLILIICLAVLLLLIIIGIILWCCCCRNRGAVVVVVEEKSVSEVPPMDYRSPVFDSSGHFRGYIDKVDASQGSLMMLSSATVMNADGSTTSNGGLLNASIDGGGGTGNGNATTAVGRGDDIPNVSRISAYGLNTTRYDEDDTELSDLTNSDDPNDYDDDDDNPRRSIIGAENVRGGRRPMGPPDHRNDNPITSYDSRTGEFTDIHHSPNRRGGRRPMTTNAPFGDSDAESRHSGASPPPPPTSAVRRSPMVGGYHNPSPPTASRSVRIVTPLTASGARRGGLPAAGAEGGSYGPSPRRSLYGDGYDDDGDDQQGSDYDSQEDDYDDDDDADYDDGSYYTGGSSQEEDPEDMLPALGHGTPYRDARYNNANGSRHHNSINMSSMMTNQTHINTDATFNRGDASGWNDTTMYTNRSSGGDGGGGYNSRMTPNRSALRRR